jgi:hypothetical protein
MASTIFSSSSPFSVGTSAPAQSAPTTLTPTTQNQAAINIAYTFYPPAPLSLLARMAASVLLTEQAGKPPVILEEHNASAYADSAKSAFTAADNSFSLDISA